MPAKLDTIAKEESAYIISCAFLDEDGDTVIPSVITWTLTDTNGTVINSRTDVSVATPASTIDVVLSGDDLAIQTGETTRRRIPRKLTVEATYNSSAGSGLLVKDSVVFDLENLTKVT